MYITTSIMLSVYTYTMLASYTTFYQLSNAILYLTIIIYSCMLKPIKKEITQRQPLYKEKSPLICNYQAASKLAICNCIIQCFTGIVNRGDFENTGDKQCR
jgi:hypothetical protein